MRIVLIGIVAWQNGEQMSSKNKGHKKRGGKPPLNSAENTRNYAIAK